MASSTSYTSHLGYLPPEFRPQFSATVGSTDLAAHVVHAAELGMGGVLYPWAAERPSTEVDAVRRALDSAGLTCSCVVAVPLAATFGGPWTLRTAAGRASLQQHVTAAAKVASSLGSTVLATLITSAPDRQLEGQLDNTAANLHEMAAIADDHGLVLAVEPMVALPDMLVTDTAATVELIERADHRAIGMVFDTAHVAAMDGDIREAYSRCADYVALIQIVDEPGRVEPGAGSLPLAAFTADALMRGYTGLVDLEHGWSTAGAEGEAAGLARIREFDGALQALLSTPGGSTTGSDVARPSG